MAPASESSVRRAVRAIAVALVVVDLGSLSFLLWTLDIAWYLSIPLGIGISFFTGYELQWRYLLSPSAFRAAGSKARFVAAAFVIVVVNLGASTLLLLWYPYAYLAVRIVAALIGAYGFTRWQVNRVRK